MDFTQVRPGVLTTVLDAEQATATIIAGNSRCLLVDTGATPATGAELRQAAARTGVPLETVIVTHGHWDHAFGLAAFADLDTVGHENLVADLRCTENLHWAAAHGIDLDDVPLPAHLLASIGVRNLGGLTVEIAHLGPAHTRSDLVVAVPERQVILVGDLVETGPPQFDETSDLDGWVRSLDALYNLVRDDAIVIPGHGDPIDRATVAHFRAGLAAIWDQAEWTFNQGVEQSEAYDYDNLEWPWDRGTVEQGIGLAYRELAARGAQENHAVR